MAVCEIWDVRGRLDHPIDYASNPKKTANPKYNKSELQALCDVMGYATNSSKTEKQFFVSGINCDPTTARDEMMITKAQFQDESKIVCYHGYQSFKENELTPDTAHEIGVKLAKAMWGDRFQVIVATHLDTNHLHNHFVVNSVSFTDGKHYHDNKTNLKLLRNRSDELCREYELSVIENPKNRKKSYALYKAEKLGMPTRDNVVRAAIDEAISKSYTLKDFDRLMNEMGYRISFDSNRKYWTVIGTNWKRPKRLYKLGEEYTNERITERIRENSYSVTFSEFQRPKYRVCHFKGTLKPAKKVGGLRGLYLHYCFRLGILPKKKQNYARVHYLLKDELIKMDTIAKETRLLCRYHIDTTQQLFEYKSAISKEAENLIKHRKELYSKSRYTTDKEKKGEIKSQLSDIADRLKVIKTEVKLCEGIENRSVLIKDTLTELQSKEQNGKELKSNEHRWRRSRADSENEPRRI